MTLCVVMLICALKSKDSAVSEWEQYLKQFKLVDGRLWELPVRAVVVSEES